MSSFGGWTSFERCQPGWTGCPPEQVRAVFHFVRHDVTLRPVDLLDAPGLRALVQAVPEAG